MSESTQSESSELHGQNWELPEMWERLLYAEGAVPEYADVRPSHTDEADPSWSAWINLGNSTAPHTIHKLQQSDLLHVVRFDVYDGDLVVLCDIPRKFR